MTKIDSIIRTTMNVYCAHCVFGDEICKFCHQTVCRYHQLFQTWVGHRDIVCRSCIRLYENENDMHATGLLVFFFIFVFVSIVIAIKMV